MTNVGGNVELVQNKVNGYVVDKGDYVALADSISLIIKDEEGRNTMSDRAKEIVNRNYSIDKTVDSYITLYKR